MLTIAERSLSRLLQPQGPLFPHHAPTSQALPSSRPSDPLRLLPQPPSSCHRPLLLRHHWKRINLQLPTFPSLGVVRHVHDHQATRPAAHRRPGLSPRAEAQVSHRWRMELHLHCWVGCTSRRQRQKNGEGQGVRRRRAVPDGDDGRRGRGGRVRGDLA